MGTTEPVAEHRLFEITTEAISVDDVHARVATRSVGAITSFTGTVRERTGERQVESLEYEAYPEMAEAMLERGIRLSSGTYRWHVASTHTDEDIEKTIAAAYDALRAI